MESTTQQSLEDDVRGWFASRYEATGKDAVYEISRRLKRVDVGVYDLNPHYSIEKKMCFNNAMKVSFAQGMDFVFGYMIDLVVPVPIMHAFNADGDTYLDMTVQLQSELSLEERVYFEILRVESTAMDKVMPPDDCPFFDQHLMCLFAEVVNGQGPEGMSVPDVQV